MSNGDPKPRGDSFVADILADGRSGKETFIPRVSWAQRRAAANAMGPKPVVPVVAPKAAANTHPKKWGKPTPSPRAEFDPRAHDICSDVIPRMNPEEMDLGAWVRHEALCDLAEPIGIWVLISAIGRGGNKERCIIRATQQMAVEALRNDAIRILFRWALTFGVYPIGILKGGERAGDVERWVNIAYRLHKWAGEHKHPQIKDLEKVYQLNGIHPKAPDSEVEEIYVPYEEIEEIAIRVGIDSIAIKARETAPIAKPKVKTEAPKPTVMVDEDTDDEVTASPGTKVVTIEEEVKAITPEPTPTVAKPVEAPKPTADKAVIISTPSKDERIEAKATALAEAKGHNYAKAIPALRGFYRKEAKRLLKL